jgi:hypothetical protein
MGELDRLGKLHFPAKGNRLRLKNYLDEGLGVPVARHLVGYRAADLQ